MRKTTLETEWEKLAHPGMGAEATWSAAVEISQDRLMNKLGLHQCKVIETAHPYESLGSNILRLYRAMAC